MLEGDRSALRDIRRQVDSLRDREAAAGASGASRPTGQQPEQAAGAPAGGPGGEEDTSPVTDAAAPRRSSETSEGAGAVGLHGSGDIVSALKLPRFIEAQGSSSSSSGPADSPLRASLSPPTFASSALARAEAERLRRERRALLGGAGGGGEGHSASHPLVRQIDRLTVLADRQATALQARGL